MRLLVSGATHYTVGTPTVLRLRSPYLGALQTPRNRGTAWKYAERDIPWAMDNACFTGLDKWAYRAMLMGCRGIDGLLFVTVPDVVASHSLTLALFTQWHAEVVSYGYAGKLAFVLQDGCDVLPVLPDVGTLFIGGSTEYKLSPTVARLTREARACGMAVHMGRVNSRRRLTYAWSIGCTSVDGSGFSRYPSTILWALAHIARLHQLGRFSQANVFATTPGRGEYSL